MTRRETIRRRRGERGGEEEEKERKDGAVTTTQKRTTRTRIIMSIEDKNGYDTSTTIRRQGRRGTRTMKKE